MQNHTNLPEEAALLGSFDMDTIGEVLNISMGAAATAVSTILDKEVQITTPQVSIALIEDYEYEGLEPALGIEIEYIQGLSGSSFLLMKKSDIRLMVDLLIGESESQSGEDELDEIHISAICEIMNQMMGASSTALASFFGKSIDISVPKSFAVDEFVDRITNATGANPVVVVRFAFRVEGLIDSQFITAMSVEFAKDMVAHAVSLSDPAPKQKTAASPQPIPAEIHPAACTAPVQPPVSAQTIPAAAVRSSQVSVQPLQLQSFDEGAPRRPGEGQANLDLIMGVPLDITVEIGRTKKPVKEILEIRQGTLLELDKQAGDPVDVIVNGQLIARGDVVVVDDLFGVRITEILQNKELPARTH